MLRLDRMPVNGLLLPFGGWGTTSRLRTGVGTYHFYVDDYRFENVWKHPQRIVDSLCREAVEPNFSLYQTTPMAFGMYQLYRKRWIARWLQEHGLRIWVDLNVSPKFAELNLLGIPHGYNAFATRGHINRPESILDELAIARAVSGKDQPNMIVYGGGKEVRALCLENHLVYLEPFMDEQRKRRKEAPNG